MKAGWGIAAAWLVRTLSLACLSGCFHWQPESEPEPVPPIAALEAKVRMEFVENQVNRDSLLDIFAGIEISHAVPGRVYHVSAGIEFVGTAGGRVFGEDYAAQDTVFHLSWIFTEEVRNSRGVTFRGRFSVDSVELGRDSLIYY